MASSSATIDRNCRTWYAAYPPKGSVEALATVTEDDGAFVVSVAAVGWALKRHVPPVRACRVETLAEARTRADALAAQLLGREVVAKWRGPAAESV